MTLSVATVWVAAGILITLRQGFASNAQERLIRKLFLTNSYHALTRPVNHENETVTVTLEVRVNMLFFVSDQVMRTNGFLGLDWNDPRLTWNPEEYSGIERLRMPPDKVWQPDIALTNAVDTQFVPNYQSNAVIEHNGAVRWVPPFIFKTGCDTSPYFFPFDRQLCNIVFRSTTYNAAEVDFTTNQYMELYDYPTQPGGIWNVTRVPLKRQYRLEYRKHGPVPCVSVLLALWVARNSMFYVLTFLIPCVCIAFLTAFVFYLPIASGEKLSMAISILFSIVVFLILLVDILPPSDSVPLMTKYLVFCFVCNFISAVLTTVTVNFSFRSVKTHVMLRWIKKWILKVIPNFVRIARPEKFQKKKLFSNAQNPSSPLSKKSSRKRTNAQFANGTKVGQRYYAAGISDDLSKSALKKKFPPYKTISFLNPGFTASSESNKSLVFRELYQLGEYLQQYPGYLTALDNIAYIARTMEKQEEEGDVADDWKFVALAADRFLLWVFLIGNLTGVLTILFNSPFIFRPQPVPEDDPEA